MQNKPTKKKRDKRKMVISVLAMLMVVCMLIPMVSMIVTAAA